MTFFSSKILQNKSSNTKCNAILTIKQQVDTIILVRGVILVFFSRSVAPHLCLFSVKLYTKYIMHLTLALTIPVTDSIYLYGDPGI